MTAEAKFIRQLAAALHKTRDFSQNIPDEEEAARFFHRTVFKDRCPTCGSPRCSLREKTVACSPCAARRSLTANTPLRNTKIPLRHWLAAIWHLHVDTVSISSRRFAFRYQTRAMTAWRLLHRVRDAFVSHAPETGGPKRQILGRRSPSNRAIVQIGHRRGTPLAYVLPFPTGRPQRAPEASLELGLVHAWVVSLFRGVSRAHLPRYLSEYSARATRSVPLTL